MTSNTTELQRRARSLARPSATSQPRTKTSAKSSPPSRPALELLLPVFFFIGFAFLLEPLWPLGQGQTRIGDLLQIIRPYAILPVLGLLTIFMTGIVAWHRLCWHVNHAPRFREDHCPNCGGTHLHRARRKPLDRRVDEMGLHVRRYTCSDCRWYGLRVKGALVEN